MTTIRERVTQAAVSAMMQSILGNYGTAWAGQRAGSYFDVAIRAGASEHQAAEIALDQFGVEQIDHWTEIANCRGSAWSEIDRANKHMRAGQLMRIAGNQFAREGERAAFDRLCQAAELAA